MTWSDREVLAYERLFTGLSKYKHSSSFPLEGSHLDALQSDTLQDRFANRLKPNGSITF